MNTSRHALLLLALVALLPATGCFLFGERFITTKTVSLKLRLTARADGVGLAVDASEFGAALRLIDKALTSDGLSRVPSEPGMADQGFIVSYARYNGIGPRPIESTRIYLRAGQLDIVVSEYNRTGHLTVVGKRVCKLLREELGRRFGAKRIKVTS